MEKPPNLVVKLGEHPLQNRVILKILFDLLESSATLDDWKDIRVVCKLWHSETLSRWRSHAILDLVKKPKSLSRSKKLTASGLLNHWQNPSDPYNLKGKPYLNYLLQDKTIWFPVCDSSLRSRLFWSSVGPWMKNLILRGLDFDTRDEGPSELLQFLIDKTPSLEQLTFDCLVMHEDELVMAYSPHVKCSSVVSFTCIDSYIYPFFCFPNLQKVRLDCRKPIEFPYLVFPDFPDMPEQNPVENSKVTHLDMMNCIDDCLMQDDETRFHNIKFPSLKHLSLNLNNSWSDYILDEHFVNEFGYRLIENHRETLKVLEVFCWVPPRFGDWAIKYSMPMLSKLFLWGNCIDNLDILRLMPNLTLLHIDLYGFEKKEEMKRMLKKGSIEVVTQRAYIPTGDKVGASRLSGNLAGVVLSELEYLQINYKVCSESVRALGEWMPNLKIFKGVLDSSTLPIVSDVWPKLEKLHCLFGSEIKDEDVIGSVEIGLKKGVADLKDLRSFHYNSRCDNSSLSLSDKCVNEGFLKMNELTDLQICVSKDFSLESEDALTSQIQNGKVFRNYTENENHADWKCCRHVKYLEYISNYQRHESSDSDSDDSGSYPDDSGSDPNDSGSDSNDSGSDPNDSGSDPNDSGSDPNDSGSDPNDSGPHPDDSGSDSDDSDCRRDVGGILEEPPNLVLTLGEHPLQNQAILKIIFNHLESSATLEDWKNIRLVCKLWHSQTLSRWRSNAFLNFFEEIPLFHPYESESKLLSASHLLIHMLNPNGPYKLKENPYLNYMVEYLTIDLQSCESNLTVSLFWSTVGPWMKSLILTKVNFETGVGGTSELLQFLIDKTPNLEQVRFDRLKWGEVKTSGLPKKGLGLEQKYLECASVVSLTYRDSFMYQFFCFPNLQEIRFEFLDSTEPVQFVELLELLLFPDFSTIPEHNPLQYSKVTHLDMMNCAVDESVRRQTNIKFPFLEHLSFNLSYAPRHSNDQPFSEFGNSMIANHRETLKVLKAFCWIPPRFGDWTIKYPMHVLSKLFLLGNCIDNLDFLRFTPNLTLLHIDLYGFEKQHEMKRLLRTKADTQSQIVTQRAYIPTGDIVEASRLSGNLTGVVLSELQHFQLNHIVGSESVRALGEWMPNLKIFKGVLDSSSLPIVCEVWPKLEKLHCLFGSEIVEEDVVGTTGSRKGVATLKILRSFHYNSRCDNSSLSDKSVKEGFLKMKELTDLQICVSKDFSRESEDALNSQIQNVKVYRNYSENEDHKDWKCCRYMVYLEHISNYQYK